ncbi:MAG: hypothetical protein ACO3GR_03210 [Candidatus Kapaibacteriota bacterium]
MKNLSANVSICSLWVAVSIITTMIMPFHTLGMDNSCLFKNPLCFYATDILSYLQILHKNSRYEEMLPFLYEPNELKKMGKTKALKSIESMNFGYEFRRVGIKEEQKGVSWRITYQRTIFGTAETFTVNCKNISDTTRLLMNTTQRRNVFYRKMP